MESKMGEVAERQTSWRVVMTRMVLESVEHGDQTVNVEGPEAESSLSMMLFRRVLSAMYELDLDGERVTGVWNLSVIRQTPISEDDDGKEVTASFLCSQVRQEVAIFVIV